MANGITNQTFFGKLEVKFQMPSDDEKVEIVPFLQAARQMPNFVELLGVAFKPIKSDIQGNIDKIKKVLDKHSKQNFKTFHDLIEYEKVEKLHKQEGSGTVSLLWLKRAFNYIILLLESLAEDHRNGKKQENMVPNCTIAYEASLKMYHKWIIQKIFSVMMKACPYRKDFLKAIADGSDLSEDEIIREVEQFLAVMRPNVDALCNLYTEMDVDYQYKV